MKCQNCGLENLEQATFCANCGANLAKTISLRKEETPPAFMGCTSTENSGQSEPTTYPAAAPSAPSMEPEPPLSSANAFAPQANVTTDNPYSSFGNPPFANETTDFYEHTPGIPLPQGELEPSISWYQSTWVCIIALLLFFPLGGFLLWKYHKNWAAIPKVATTCGFGLLFLAFVVFGCMALTVVHPVQLQILSDPQTINLNESEYIDFEITPSNASCEGIEFIATEDNILQTEPVIENGKMRGKITAIGKGKTFVYLYYNKRMSNAVEITVLDPADDQKAADEFSEKIRLIGTVTLDKATQIDSLKGEYARLPIAIKELISNADVLDEAYQKLKTLKREEAKRINQAIQDAEAAIGQIGDVTLEKEALIIQVRDTITNTVPLAEQKRIANLDVLVEAETVLTELQEEQEYIDSCEPITFNLYESILRSPDQYKGDFVQFQGEIFQISEETEEESAYLISLYDEEGDTNELLYVTYHLDGQDRLLEGDYVTVYGSVEGLQSYITVSFTTNTVPLIQADIIDWS